MSRLRDVSRVFVEPKTTLREVMEGLDGTGAGIALVVDADQRLVATVTDGDVRRALLRGARLEDGLAETTLLSPRRRHVTAPVGSADADLLRIMVEFDVRHVPLVDAERRVRDLVVLDDVMREPDATSARAVVMAGGFGRRLRPLTDNLPKPMLPVGDRPLLELTVDRLRRAGIRQVHLTTHYLADVIRDHFGDGSRFEVAIDYVRENHPLGTAGALSRLEPTDDPVLVMNGDVLTHLDFRAMLDFHREEDAALTVGVRAHRVEIPYGVITSDGRRVTGIEEKPVFTRLINAGIYVLAPEVLARIPADRPSDMPELVQRLVGDGERVVSFPVTEYWQDIGHLADYDAACAEVGAEASAQRGSW